MGIYIPKDDDLANPSEYVIAFKGTTWYNLWDWQNNVEQLLSSKSADMWDAINYGIEFVNSHPEHEITFVSHSKGGAEAASAAGRSGIFPPPGPRSFSGQRHRFPEFSRKRPG